MGAIENSKPRTNILYLGGRGIRAGTHYLYHLLSSFKFPFLRGGL